MALSARPRPTTLGELARALGAALGLLGLAVGAPLLLSALVGNPLPTKIPSGDEFSRAITGEISETTIVKAAAVVAWLIWAQLVITLPAELIAAVRDRPARRLPVLAPIQSLVGRLAATAVLLVSAFAVRPAPADAHPPPPIESHLEWHALDPEPGAPAPPPDAAAAPTPDVAPPTYTVAHLDTLWAIAERTLGDPYRWPEIEALNTGQPQPDGETLQPDGPLRPGWTLVLPPDASPRAATSPVPDGDPVTVEPGDTLWGIADDHLGDPHRWPEIEALNTGRPQPDGQALSDPDLIVPGWQLQLPAAAPASTPPEPSPPPAPPLAPAPEPAEPTPETPPPDATSPPAPPEASSPPATEAPRDPPPPPAAEQSPDADSESNRPPLAAILGASGLLAAGLVAILNRHRATLQRLRPFGRRLPTSSPPLQEIERRLRSAAQVSPAEWLATANRALTGALRRTKGAVPQPVAARLGSTHLEILLAEPGPADAPSPFEATADRWVWQLSRQLAVDELAAVAGEPALPALPALVTIGYTDDGPLLLDLEACGHVSLDGPPEQVAGLVRSLALELAVTPAAEWVDVVLVDDPALLADPDRPEPLDVPALTSERLRVVTAVDEAGALLAATARSIGRALDDAGAATTLAARARTDHYDTWAPTIAVLPGPPDTETRTLLEACTAPGRGAAIIAAGPWPAPWEIHVRDDGRVEIPRLGAHAHLAEPVRSQALDDDQVEASVELIDTTRADTERAAEDPEHTFPPRDEAPSAQASEDSAHDPFEETPIDVEVRVLGEIDIAGLTQPLRGVETELIVYLATHDRPVDAEKVITALWPNAEPSQQRWSNILNVVRRALGEHDGDLHLPHQHSSRTVTLGPRVRSDLERLHQRLRAVERADPTARLQLLTEAAGFIRGIPFTKPPTRRRGGYAWASSENISYYAESLVTDTTHALALIHLARDDPAAALAATDRGLAAAPNAERLYQDRMDAHHALGNTHAVETEMNRLLKANDIIDPIEQLDPETLRRFEEYTHRPLDALPTERQAAN